MQLDLAEKCVRFDKVTPVLNFNFNEVLIPSRGFIKPSDRKSLTTLLEDVENTVRTAVNIETGHIYVKGTVK